MKLCIAGSREYPHLDFVEYYLWTMRAFVLTLVNGMCPRGVDAVALECAHRHGIAVDPRPADWNKHGRAAGPRRNTRMVHVSDAVVVFWDGKSRGSMNIIGTARQHGKLLAVYGGEMELRHSDRELWHKVKR